MYGIRYWLTDTEYIEVTSSDDESVYINLGKDDGEGGQDYSCRCSKKNAETALRELSAIVSDVEPLD